MTPEMSVTTNGLVQSTNSNLNLSKVTDIHRNLTHNVKYMYTYISDLSYGQANDLSIITRTLTKSNTAPMQVVLSLRGNKAKTGYFD